MLEDKIKLLKDIKPLKLACMAIEIAKPAKEAIRKACGELKDILDGGEFVAVDEEIKTAVVSVYRILETALNGLEDKSVAPLFDSGE